MYFGEILTEPTRFRPETASARADPETIGYDRQDAEPPNSPTGPDDNGAIAAAPSGTWLLARAAVLDEARALLARGDHVLLVGPAGVGKTVLIQALTSPALAVLDPLVDVSPHAAGHIRRAMDRGVQFLGATRSLDRAYLGAVRRIAWRFTTVRVPRLSARWMRHVISQACTEEGLLPGVSSCWVRAVVQLAAGCPGVALAIVRAAAQIRGTKGEVPSPAAACIEASVERYDVVRAARALARSRPAHHGRLARPSSRDFQ